jgi:selenide,water dikinase
MNEIRLTQYSHGAGCGCKISPSILDEILHTNEALPHTGKLIVGNSTRDDAAVYDLDNGTALISTTDFFMPIVDDPFEFGKIASANAISDVYAMGGKPIMAIAILGWPIDKLSPDIARRVIEGSRTMCAEAGIPLAGGHSIDSPEPIFGLAVNGLVAIDQLKQNTGAKPGDILYLTKPLGIGILTTAEKKSLLREEHLHLAASWMMKLNAIGTQLATIDGVHALTDVTGFGLFGHLIEMCEGSDVHAELLMENIPLLDSVMDYAEAGSIPGGTHRNWKSYGHKVGEVSDAIKHILADPQTSGGLLIAVDPKDAMQVEELLNAHVKDFTIKPIGRCTEQLDRTYRVSIR